MKHLALLCLATAMLQLTHAQTAGYLKKDDGSSGTINCYGLYEDGTGNTGIGTTVPNASLQINHNAGSGVDFLSVTQTTIGGVFPSFTYTQHSKFVVQNNGNVGIGIAEPLALLHLSSNKAWAAADGDFFANVKLLGSNAAGDPFFFASDMSFADGSTHIPAGFLGVISAPSTFSFAVLDPLNNIVGLGASGDGTVVVNFDMANEPAAQVDIRPHTGTGDILNIGDAGTTPLLRLNTNAHLGIGLLPQSGSTVVLYDGAGDTRLDLIASSGHTKALRFMNNNTTPRHVITEISGDLVIDPGVTSGGGNDLLKIAGQTYITAETGIGLVPTTSTLSIKGATETKLDLYETSSTVEYNAQLRFIGNTGNVRHIITENSNGELLIKPGWSGGAATKLEIDGQTYITGETGIGIAPTGSTLAIKGATSTILDLCVASTTADGWSSQLRFINGTTLRHVITDNPSSSVDALIIHPGYEGTSNHRVRVEGDLQITDKLILGGQTITSGVHTDAKLYVDGKIAVKACVVTLDHWSDYVFDDNYPLKSIEQLSAFMHKEKHLPGIPSAAEVEQEGNNLGEMDAKLLEKIEELSLYVVQLNEKIKQLELLNKN